MILFLVISIPVFVSLIVVIYNTLSNPVFNELPSINDNEPLVSVLIPARNEEKNIAKCLHSIINQSYKNIEILVLDDSSTDNTAEITKKISTAHSSITLISGKPLPNNVLGKNWACIQLAEKASGKYLLFIDADVTVSYQVVQSSINYFLRYNLDVLSVFPTQKNSSLGEWLVVPLMNWLLLSFLPLKLVYKSSNKSFTAANGQFIMWEKAAYDKIGGHLAAAAEVVEDMYMAKRAKQNDMKLMTLLGGNFIFCKMYDNLQTAVEGFSKNFYPGFKIPLASFSFLICFLFVINIFPFVFTIHSPIFFFTCISILLIRILISILSRQNFVLNILFHLPQMILMLITGIKSMILFSQRNITWKGRKVFI